MQLKGCLPGFYRELVSERGEGVLAVMADTGSELVDAALAPIPGDLPAGPDPRLDLTPQSPYFRLRDIRSDARSEERRAETEPELLQRSLEVWGEVVSAAAGVLTDQAKDVEIAAWLLEGLTRRDGLAGFAIGTRVLAGLIEDYWGRGLHPAAEEDDPWDPLAVVTGLSGADRAGTLIPALQRITLFEHTDGLPVTLWSYDYAREISTLDPDKVRDTRMAEIVPPFAQLEITARGPERHRLAEVLAAVDEALAAWRALDAAIATTGAPAVSTGRVLETLDRIRRIAVLYAPEVGPALASGGPDGAEAGSDASAATSGLVLPGAGRAAGPSREDMFEQVLAIARVFREREPNSAFGLTLEDAVRRARLPLTDLLREVMPDDHQRMAVLTAFGIRVSFDE